MQWIPKPCHGSARTGLAVTQVEWNNEGTMPVWTLMRCFYFYANYCSPLIVYGITSIRSWHFNTTDLGCRKGKKTEYFHLTTTIVNLKCATDTVLPAGTLELWVPPQHSLLDVCWSNMEQHKAAKVLLKVLIHPGNLELEQDEWGTLDPDHKNKPSCSNSAFSKETINRKHLSRQIHCIPIQ